MSDQQPSSDQSPLEWDAGMMGCGELILELRRRLAQIPPGTKLTLIAQDPGVPEDLPAWCRMTGHRLLREVAVGTLLLELCTPRAGELDVLAELPERLRIGVGVVNPKSAGVDSTDAVRSRAERAIRLFGAQRVLLNPDCGFATFADHPVSSAAIAEQKLATIAQVAADLRQAHHL